MQQLSFLVVLINVQYISATYDMNLRQLELVADHLTHEECRKLVETLHSKTWRLDQDATGKNEAPLPCIDLLVAWNEGEGKKSSVNDLAHRLKQIGRKDVAEKVSRTVYHEKSDNVKRAFLSDPFKKDIHSDSELLDEAPITLPEGGNKKEDVSPSFHLTGLEIGGICVSVVLLIILIGVLWIWLVPYYCPAWTSLTALLLSEPSLIEEVKLEPFSPSSRLARGDYGHSSTTSDDGHTTDQSQSSVELFNNEKVKKKKKTLLPKGRLLNKKVGI